MIGLLIAIGLTVGKIHGQEAAVSRVINSQTVQQIAENYGPLPDQEFNRRQQAVPQRQENINRTTEINNKRLASGTVRENGPKPKLFISRLIPFRMNTPTGGSSLKTNEIVSSNNRSDMCSKEVSKPKSTLNASKDSSRTPLSEGNSSAKPQVEPKIIVNSTEVTFDERASFEGDKCPTGYVKVNGKCVEAD